MRAWLGQAGRPVYHTSAVYGAHKGRGGHAKPRQGRRTLFLALGVGIVALAVGGYLLLTSGHEARTGTALRVTGAGLGGAW